TAAEHVRRHDAEAPDGDVMQLERAGARQAVDVELPWNERPVGVLVLAPDAAPHVQPPRLAIAAGVAQGAERDAEFGVPAERIDGRAHRPVGVPVDVEAAHRTRDRAVLARLLETATLPLLGDLSVVLDTGRRRGEDEPVLAIEVRVEDQGNVVAVLERDVADFFAGHDRVRIAIEHPRANVDRFTIRDDQDLSTLGYRLSLVQLALNERRERR